LGEHVVGSGAIAETGGSLSGHESAGGGKGENRSEQFSRHCKEFKTS